MRALIVAAMILSAMTAVAACAGTYLARPFVSDGAKWVETPTGERVKAGTFHRDMDTGKVSNRQGDTEGVEDWTPEELAKHQAVTGKSKKGTDAPAKPNPADGIYRAASMIGWAGGLLLLASIAGVVASFFLPIVPRSTALKGFGVALALFVVQYWVAAYGVTFSIVTFWIGLAAAVVALLAVAYPWFKALFNRQMGAQARELAAKGDAHGAAAVTIAANPKKYATPGAKTGLKTALAVAATKEPAP